MIHTVQCSRKSPIAKYDLSWSTNNKTKILRQTDGFVNWFWLISSFYECLFSAFFFRSDPSFTNACRFSLYWCFGTLIQLVFLDYRMWVILWECTSNILNDCIVEYLCDPEENYSVCVSLFIEELSRWVRLDKVRPTRENMFPLQVVHSLTDCVALR